MSYHDKVEKLARAEFGSSEIEAVEVEIGEGWDDSPTVDITISLNSAIDRFDVEKAAAFKQALREYLDDQEGRPMPIVSFVPRAA